MRILTRYLLREVLSNALLGLLLFTFVIFMREAGRLLEIVVRSNSASLLVAFLYALPATLIFTIPMAVLVGILIGLGRLAGDSELTAMRAAGVNTRTLMRPLMMFAVGALGLGLVTSLWIAPLAARNLLNMETGLRNSQIKYEVQPRVFIENIPNMVVYVGDAINGGQRWRKVLVGEIANPGFPRLTLARRGELLNTGPNSLQLHLQQGATYEATPARPSQFLVNSFLSSDLPILLKPTPPPVLSPQAMNLGQLWWAARYSKDWRSARIEFHRRFSLAFAALALALAGIPLGLSASRGARGSKSNGFLLTLLLVFGYYIVFILGLSMARQGRVAPWFGLWAPDIACGLLGLWLLSKADDVPRRIQRSHDPAALVKAWAAGLLAKLQPRAGRLPFLRKNGGRRRKIQMHWALSLIDLYVFREFVSFVALILGSFLILLLAFTFFELVGDMVRTHSSMGLMLRYLLYLSPQMLYLIVPVGILVGVLVTFGLMSRANEITALKACGTSIYRLLVPVTLVALLLAGGQFWMDQTYLPGFNRKQDALRSEIKGQAPRTFQRPEHRWVWGKKNDLYYFQYFDPAHNELSGVSVFTVDPATFALRRAIFARDAHWDSGLNNWVFEAGWRRDFEAGAVTNYEAYTVASFSGLPEQPSYFSTNANEYAQMSYGRLQRYIHDLQRSGYQVARLRVELQKKIAYPIISLVMALLAFPFSMSVGKRGTVTGIALAIFVAIFYWIASGFLEALGNLNQLPPSLAAWTPDLLFAALGIYFLLRVPT